MTNYTFCPSEIKVIWKRTKNKHYSIRSFIKNGDYVEYIIFDDKQTGYICTGKVVTKFLEGEVYHWPRLRHCSLAPLLDVIYIDERLSIYMTIPLVNTLRDIIHDDDFVNDPLNFDRKKAYIEDVLLGVDYLHSKRLSLMNISDANVLICPESDKAILANFTCLAAVHNAKKHMKCAPYMYRAPELSKINPLGKKYKFDPIYSDIWSIGVMIMEIFLNHRTPWGLVNYEPSRALELSTKIDSEMLKISNNGSVTKQDVDDLKKYLTLFLESNPKRRCSASKAASKKFIQNEKYRIKTNRTIFMPRTLENPRNSRDSDESDFSSLSNERLPMFESTPISKCELLNLSRLNIDGHQSSNVTNRYFNQYHVTNIIPTHSEPNIGQGMILTKYTDHSDMMKGDRPILQVNTCPEKMKANAVYEVNSIRSEIRSQFALIDEILERNASQIDDTKQNKIDSPKSDLAKNVNGSCYENVNAFHSYSETRIMSAKTNSPIQLNSVQVVSAPVLRNLVRQSKECALQQGTEKKEQHDQNPQDFAMSEYGHKLISKAIDIPPKSPNRSSLIDKSTQAGSEEILQLNNQGKALTFPYFSADKNEMRDIKSKSAAVILQTNKDTLNGYVRSGGKKNLTPRNFFGINHQTPNILHKETKQCLLPETGNDIFLTDKSCSIKAQNLELEMELFNLNDSHLSPNNDFFLPKSDRKPRQVNVTRHRRGCSHHSQNEYKSKRNKQIQQITNVAEEDGFSTKQKCEDSKFLLNSEDIKIDVDTSISRLQSQIRHIKNDATKKVSKRKKEKLNLYCFGRK